MCIDDEISEGIDISQPASEDTLKKSQRAIAEYDVDKTFNAATRLVDEIIANSASLENGYHILKTYDENTCEYVSKYDCRIEIKERNYDNEIND